MLHVLSCQEQRARGWSSEGDATFDPSWDIIPFDAFEDDYSSFPCTLGWVREDEKPFDLNCTESVIDYLCRLAIALGADIPREEALDDGTPCWQAAIDTDEVRGWMRLQLLEHGTYVTTSKTSKISDYIQIEGFFIPFAADAHRADVFRWEPEEIP